MKSRKLTALLAAALVVALSAAVIIPTLAAGETGTMLISPAPAEKINAPAKDFGIVVDGEKIDAYAMMMVPARAVGEAMGYTVTWLGDGKFTLENAVVKATVTLGRDVCTINRAAEDGTPGTALYDMGMPPYCVEGVSYVPLGLFDQLEGGADGLFSFRSGNIVVDRGTGDTREYSRTTLIVRMAENTAADKAKALFDRLGLEIVYSYLDGAMYAVKTDHEMTDAEMNRLMSALLDEDIVVGVEKDYVVRLPEDPTM